MTLTDKNHLISAYESAWYLVNGKKNNLIVINIESNGFFEITIHTGLPNNHEKINTSIRLGKMLKNLAVMTVYLLERQ